MKKNGFVNNKRGNCVDGNESFWDDVTMIKIKLQNIKLETLEMNQKILTPQFRSNEKSEPYNKPKVVQKDLNLKKPTNSSEDYITFEHHNSKKSTLSTLKSKTNSETFEQDVFMNYKRAEKFNNFLNIYDPPKLIKQNNRFENLYGHAKIKNMYLDKLRNTSSIEKVQNEEKECTFAPPMNNRSRSLANSICNKGNIYQRNVIWNNNRNSKIKQNKRTQILKTEEYTFRPTLSEYHISNPNNNVLNNKYTAQYFGRQHKARFRKSTSACQSKYKECTSEPSHYHNKSFNISQQCLYEYKATLHDELFHNCVDDD